MLSQDPACANAGMFYDFYVPMVDMGISIDTPLRIAGATASSPGSALNGSASDVANIEDDFVSLSGRNATIREQDSLFSLLISSYEPIEAQNLTSLLGGDWSLPLEITNLSATNNTIQWSVSTHGVHSVSAFEVEESVDGKSFYSIASYDGGGNIYTHPTPANGQYYYRIKQISHNGTIDYTEVLHTNNTSLALALDVFPNPSDGDAQIAIHSPTAANVLLVNTSGVVVYTTSLEAGASIANLPTLDKGVYVVKLASESEVITKQLLVN